MQKNQLGEHCVVQGKKLYWSEKVVSSGNRTGHTVLEATGLAMDLICREM